ncbi:hypothetical protein cypCar_00036069 [Cyprinus carpio]|nr:hypothetical protein cypCar_00036069 [Cyprinus carpio]
MPTVHDWISDPLGVVEGLFAQSNTCPDWEKKVVEYFKEKLKPNDAHTWVPSLNDVPLHYLKPNSLVKFRCMVQDMFDPEFFMGVYETNDPTLDSKQVKCGKYKDITEGGQVDFNSRNTVTSERQTFYCVPIPGESQWVKEISFTWTQKLVWFPLQITQNSYAGTSQARVVPSTSYVPNRHKRSYEEDDEMDTQPQQMKGVSQGAQSSAESHGNIEPKRQETEAPSHDSSPSHCTSSLDLNFPLPGEKGPACLVKVYEDWDGFKLNDMLEVFGILSVDPALSVIADEREASSLLHPTEGMETVEEQRVHSPPASLVPRLHMLYAQPLVHNNPLLPSSVLENNGDYLSSVLGELASIRAELLTYLTHVLLGDSLAAEYLILHLISNVYSRRDVLPLGKFTLNLSGCPHSSPYTEHLYKVIQQLVPSSYRLCMSLHNMNNQRMVPRKDYTANRLVSGTLQLANNTSLFLDETQLEQGQLDATGVRNITALGNLITWQKVDYDFNYHQMEFSCNINVLITSEGRSLLPAVEEDFVEMRKDDPQSMSAEDLHRLLVVARLLSLSNGQNTLSRDGWMKAKQLEALRMSRTQQQKCVNGNEP